MKISGGGNGVTRNSNCGSWNCNYSFSKSIATLCLLAMMRIQCGSSYAVVKDGLSITTSNILRYNKPGELVFSEEFFELDRTIWTHEIAAPGRTNGEFQAYTDNPENSYVRDGILYIKPTYYRPRNETTNNSISNEVDRQGKSLVDGKRKPSVKLDFTSPIASARLNTRRSFAFRYGQLEVRAKLPEGDWIWPAIWLLPQGNTFGLWPNSGEIDLMESRGNRELVTSAGDDIGSNQFGSTLHFGHNRTTDRWRLAHFTKTDKRGFNSEFHAYGMVWTPDEIAFTLDGDVIGVVTPPAGGFWEMGNFTGPKLWDDEKISPFDKPFYLVLNVAVGGTFGYFPENTGPKRKPWINSSPTAPTDFWESRDEWQPTWNDEDSAMQIDYIRIWAL